MNDSTIHIPVLLHEVLEWSGLKCDVPHVESSKDGRIVVDGTLGGGGHSLKLIELLTPMDTLIAFDRDARATRRVEQMLQSEHHFQAADCDKDELFPCSLLRHENRCNVIICSTSYCHLPEVMSRFSVLSVHCILLDLGLSSDQLQDRDRGFSFRVGGPLDLRFDPTDGPSAADLVNSMGEGPLADVIYEFGEERFSRRIARAIVEYRKTHRIETSEQLADIVHRAVPGRVHGRIDSATRTFQALRIAVNEELEHVKKSMERLPGCLSIGGRMMVISFHSLEDRIVKHSFRENSQLKVLTKKPILPTEFETDQNPRSRSAKLRVVERVED